VRIRVCSLWIVLAAFSIAVPVWAAHVDATQYLVTTSTQIGSATLTPGEYVLRAREGGNQLEIVRDGKVISEVPCQWEQLPEKARENAVLSSSNAVKEIHFSGRTAAVKIESAQASQGQ
jgi:hypothetical protein